MKTAKSDTRPTGTADRVAALRGALEARGVTGFLVPRADEHQGEYVPPHAERLAWLTGFDGSAGFAVVLADRAAIFTDGRYTLQVREQVDTAVFEIQHITKSPPGDWIAGHVGGGAALGYDPWLHTPAGLERIQKACENAGAGLVALDDNPIDAIWPDQPPPPTAPVLPHPLDYAGRESADKRREIAKALAKAGTDAVVLTLPDSIAWLLNIRGGDVPRTPMPLSFALLRADATVDLFVDKRKTGDALAQHLGDDVRLASPADFGPALDSFAGRVVQADPATAADWIFRRLDATGAKTLRADDPCQLPKACKNAVELSGARNAHVRDGAALSRFLAWLSEEAPSGALTELQAADRLEQMRRQSNLLRDLSFDTISGAGPNGAIVHYRVSEDSNRVLEPGSLYLVDSGAQYPDGTTDVTRTIAIGTPSPEMRERFTRVLKGHIALATARFPEGTTGSQLDTMARLPLWQVGLDYDHGTGHGVGSYLAVHEGPQRISKMPNTVALKPGMIVSNEPGYYKTGAYGIRIENLVAVTALDGGGEQTMLGFETLTLAPIDLALVETGAMTDEEIAWLDDYHRRVRETLTPLVDDATVAWLAAATRSLTV